MWFIDDSIGDILLACDWTCCKIIGWGIDNSIQTQVDLYLTLRLILISLGIIWLDMVGALCRHWFFFWFNIRLFLTKFPVKLNHLFSLVNLSVVGLIRTVYRWRWDNFNVATFFGFFWLLVFLTNGLPIWEFFLNFLVVEIDKSWGLAFSLLTRILSLKAGKVIALLLDSLLVLSFLLLNNVSDSYDSSG